MTNRYYESEEEKGFFKWLFGRWYFWIISIVWGVWSGIEELQAHYVAEFLGILFASFFLVGLICWIIYMVKRSINKQVQKELQRGKEK